MATFYQSFCYAICCVVKMAESKVENQIKNCKEIYKITKGFCLIINTIDFNRNKKNEKKWSRRKCKTN